MPSPNAPTILFAGGGSGGHIFPNVAILERLRDQLPGVQPLFAVSQRSLDAQILRDLDLPMLALPVRPFSTRPWHWPAFWSAWRASIAATRAAIAEHSVRAVVATGGFVSGPVVVAARKAGLPAALANLDAAPGRANRHVARRASKVFSVYATPQLPGAQVIGMPLRRIALSDLDAAESRRQLGLLPDRPTLLVTGASQGASSLNQMLIRFVADPASRPLLEGWQVLHLAGDKDADVQALRRAYAEADIPARVEPFCHTMGLAWGAASVALSRAGAGSVGEVWANAVPTIFYPYPWHKDQHQKLNAQPLTVGGAAVLLTDLIDPGPNAGQLARHLAPLLKDADRRQAMARQLRDSHPPDGASVVAQWLASQVR